MRRVEDRYPHGPDPLPGTSDTHGVFIRIWAANTPGVTTAAEGPHVAGPPDNLVVTASWATIEKYLPHSRLTLGIGSPMFTGVIQAFPP